MKPHTQRQVDAEIARLLAVPDRNPEQEERLQRLQAGHLGIGRIRQELYPRWVWRRRVFLPDGTWEYAKPYRRPEPRKPPAEEEAQPCTT